MNGFLLWQSGRRTQKAIRLHWLDCSLFSSRWIHRWLIFSRRCYSWILYYDARDEFSKVRQHTRSLLRSLHLLTRIRLLVHYVGCGSISEGVDARWKRAVRKWGNVHVERERVFFPHDSLSAPEALLEFLLCVPVVVELASTCCWSDRLAERKCESWTYQRIPVKGLNRDGVRENIR